MNFTSQSIKLQILCAFCFMNRTEHQPTRTEAEQERTEVEPIRNEPKPNRNRTKQNNNIQTTRAFIILHYGFTISFTEEEVKYALRRSILEICFLYYAGCSFLLRHTITSLEWMESAGQATGWLDLRWKKPQCSALPGSPHLGSHLNNKRINPSPFPQEKYRLSIS